MTNDATLRVEKDRTPRAWGVAAIVMLITVTYVPFLQPLMKTTSLSLMDWLLVIVASYAATFWIDAVKIIRSRS